MSYKQPYDRPYYSSNNMNKYVLANHNRCHLHTEVIKKIKENCHSKLKSSLFWARKLTAWV